MDKETNPRNDIKVLQRPGGNSSFKLGWDEPAPKPVKKVNPQQEEDKEKEEEEKKEQLQKKEGETDDYKKLDNVKTSVKTHAPPGGKSNFRLGQVIS